MSELAIIIPTLDEAPQLARTLPAALAAGDEVVVSDGGSTDGSVEAARRLGAAVVSGPPGRGGQLGRGAAAATAPLLLFLHADTTLPDGAVEKIRQAVRGGAVGGGFLVRFDPAGPLLRLGARLINLRTRLTRAPLGDQAQFVTREAYDQVGGLRDWPILEDLDLIRRLGRLGRVAVIDLAVTTSSRRFRQRGVLPTIVTNWTIWALYLLGCSPHRLARLYRTAR